MIKKEGNHKKISLSNITDQGNNDLLDSFYTTSDDLDLHTQNNFVQVTEKYLQVYDAEMSARFVFEGLNIRSCLNIHQSYLYTISDSMVRQHRVNATEYELGEFANNFSEKASDKDDTE